MNSGAGSQQVSGGCSSVGRVPDCDSGCRGFESRQPPQLKITAHREGGRLFYFQQALFFALPFPLFVCLTFVMLLFAFGQPDFKLDAAFAEMHIERQ